jgi:diacylglycerol kinase family enzyme
VRVAVIINPISGTDGRGATVARRVAAAHAWLTARGVEAEVCVQQTALGIVPSGSGNGLARELHVPFDPAAAVAAALDGREQLMDAGELDGRLFFNVAGVGLDARVAHGFAAGGPVRRGLRRYVALTVREWFASEPDELTLLLDGDERPVRTLIVAFANARQYGNGVRIAPAALLDDGKLDVTIIGFRGPLAGLRHVRRVLAGRIGEVAGVTLRQIEHAEVRSARPIPYHVDGEPFSGGTRLVARVRPRALRVRVPARRA